VHLLDLLMRAKPWPAWPRRMALEEMEQANTKQAGAAKL